MFLVRQNVDGKDKAQKAVDDPVGKPGHKGKQPCGHAAHKTFDQRFGLIQQLFRLVPEILDQFIFHIQLAFQPYKKVAGITDVAGDAVGQVD